MRIFPKKRGPRIAIKLALALGYAASLWFWVFPWLDRTFVNRPAL
ncbi:MAG: hypothetical protein ACRDKG_15660 [Actinomycetota bacterium]